jgi:LPLT family lysophospholipid transporter-like MFS transporter
MNALLQHRGHNLMGAGRSIAVQNFNEQACILALGALYSRHDQVRPVGLHRHRAFGLVVAGWVLVLASGGTNAWASTGP